MKSKHREECLNSAFLYLNCSLCIEEVDHEEHQYTKTEKKVMKVKVSKLKKKRRKSHKEKKKTIKSESGKLRKKEREGIKGTLKCLEPGCTYVTDSKPNITAHHNWSHTHKFYYSCNLCSFIKPSIGRVKIHQEAVHMIEEAKVVMYNVEQNVNKVEENVY